MPAPASTRSREGGATVLGGIAFAAAAAAAAVVWQLAAGRFGLATAIGTFAIGAVVVDLLWIAPDLRRGVAAAAGAGVLLGFTALVAPWLDAVLAACAVVLAVGRSGLLFRRSPARVFAVEAALLGGGLVLARLLGGPGPLGVGAAVWGFFLVQALYPAIGGARPRSDRPPGVDRFEDARRRALAVLEG
ncbi:MAG TPA: hypothetical protein VGG06_22800 [Thermoanaerobaculia bacterium]|jgi:hypothetical protein